MKKAAFLWYFLAIMPVIYSCSPAKELFELNRAPCLGKCPVYTLKVYKNGDCYYQGGNNAPMQGKYHKKISREQLNTLIKAFVDTGFFNLQDQYSENGSDLPAVFTKFCWKGKTKNIKDYNDAPAALHLLEKELDDLTKSGGWDAYQGYH